MDSEKTLEVDFKKQPISNVKWVRTDEINPNNYNPNIVARNEMKGLKNSLINNGWIFPITVTENGYIIDGYHRWWLSKNNDEIKKIYKNYIPVIVMDMEIKDAMCMTITMNAAKGTHKSSIMHELVSKLYNDMNMTKQEIANKCTMDTEEVNLLLQENVFEKLDIKNHQYSMAWVPEK